MLSDSSVPPSSAAGQPPSSLGRPPDPLVPPPPSSGGSAASPPPTSPTSYLGALFGETSHQSSSSHGKWICVGENDIVPSITNEVRAIQLSKSFKEKLSKPWTNTAVIRLLGKSIGYSYLCQRLKSLWKPTGAMQVIDLDKDCYLVKFSNEHDYFKALTGGPWMVLDHYLIVQQWEPNFRVSSKLPSRMVVWVRFPHLPILFYHPQILSALGNLLGRIVRIDLTTQSGERGKFARIAVEIDLNEPLTPVIELDGAPQMVEYENIPELCFGCGKIGHVSENFPSKSSASLPSMEQLTSPLSVTHQPDVEDPLDKRNDGLGPWMVVSRNTRRHRREGLPDKESEKERKVAGSPSQNRKVSSDPRPDNIPLPSKTSASFKASTVKNVFNQNPPSPSRMDKENSKSGLGPIGPSKLSKQANSSRKSSSKKNKDGPASCTNVPSDPSGTPSRTSETVSMAGASSVQAAPSSRPLFEGVASASPDASQPVPSPVSAAKTRSKRKAPTPLPLPSLGIQSAALKLKRPLLKNRKPPDPSSAKSKLIGEALKVPSKPTLPPRDPNVEVVAAINSVLCSGGCNIPELLAPTSIQNIEELNSGLNPPDTGSTDSDSMILDSDPARNLEADAFDLNMPEST
ncbi:hypothetical protein LINPERHAP2_LOCUS23192 [Linum perenne]